MIIHVSVLYYVSTCIPINALCCTHMLKLLYQIKTFHGFPCNKKKWNNFFSEFKGNNYKKTKEPNAPQRAR